MSPVCESVVGSEPHGSKVYGNNLPGVSGPQRLFFFFLCEGGELAKVKSSRLNYFKWFMVRQEEDAKCL